MNMLQDLEAGVAGALPRVEDLCNTLATESDTIRKQYWLHVRDTVTRKYSPAAAAAAAAGGS